MIDTLQEILYELQIKQKKNSDPKQHKTRLCKFFEEGQCRNLNLCKFAHGESELRKQEDWGKKYNKSMPNI